MKAFNSVEDILNFAINEEQSAMEFYLNLAKTAKNEEMKEAFEGFAQEELGHKTKLTEVKNTGIMEKSAEKVADLKIADFTVKIVPSPDMSYQDALVLAMKREKAAFKLYTALSQRVENPELANLFKNLAIEEAKHKLRFELEYDEFVLREN
ncbi:MAG: ferritin family protein [Bacteroidales bacterium]|jgi:rubrerythrin|nr:ferritin family protein [Bacteroidales bacterium]MDD2323566.1 ferritin family protein [Bacteroidales bacterium]MDD3960236.1 ferritin family protein [Bacteroidales bacterium]MDY0285782.1 ferritin family protein [Bacteroidales bacterium]HPE86425.1 ferritin family protein [Bacteroidales bacterium]